MDYIILIRTVRSVQQKENNPIAEQIREGFTNQRLVVIPANVIKRCHALPLIRYLYVTHIGSFPSASHHYVERKAGVPQAILMYCQDGKGTLQLGDSLFPVVQGHVMIIPPDTPHIYSADDQEPWSIFWIHFSGQQTTAVLKSLGIQAGHPLLFVPDVTLMRQAFEDVYACLNYHYNDAGLLAMTSELMRLLSKIKLHYSHFQKHRQAADDRIMDTIDFMQRHLDMPLNLEDLAARSGQSISYYSKLFKKRTNQSPMAYFIQLKTRRACELLDHTELSVREIAEELGYDDPYYFSRLFKKTQGCAPINYRKIIKG